ncbi:hypothetical protein HYX11_01070 [Candidatus Woesearchaeota archaeon]|nr:hypothetical protein [Candidatus Woesearchaeota archaeon]
MFVLDRTGPILLNVSNITVAYGANVAAQFNASDLSGISGWKVNDTTNFGINGTGYLTNATALALTTYWLNVTVNDTIGNNNSRIIFVNVTDIVAPYFVTALANQTVELGTAFSYDIDGADNYLLVNYSINDTTNFAINSSGIVINTTVLSLRNYSINVSINDTSSNSSIFIVFVLDRTGPILLNVSNITVAYGANVAAQFNASDLSGISGWKVNDTTNFGINGTGYLTNATALALTTYWLNATVNDTIGNNNSRIIFVNVTTSVNVTLDMPAASYYNDSGTAVNITFRCNATDNFQLKNVSLYLTNNTNQSFVLNQSATITGTVNSSNWTLQLSLGNYTWNCLAYDNTSVSAWGSDNRTIKLNYTAPSASSSSSSSSSSGGGGGGGITSTPALSSEAPIASEHPNPITDAQKQGGIESVPAGEAPIISAEEKIREEVKSEAVQGKQGEGAGSPLAVGMAIAIKLKESMVRFGGYILLAVAVVALLGISMHGYSLFQKSRQNKLQQLQAIRSRRPFVYDAEAIEKPKKFPKTSVKIQPSLDAELEKVTGKLNSLRMREGEEAISRGVTARKKETKHSFEKKFLDNELETIERKLQGYPAVKKTILETSMSKQKYDKEIGMIDQNLSQLDEERIEKVRMITTVPGKYQREASGQGNGALDNGEEKRIKRNSADKKKLEEGLKKAKESLSKKKDINYELARVEKTLASLK